MTDHLTDVANSTPVTHVSYSQLSSWLRCGKAYELERIARVPSVPSWALVGGSALHSATEVLDLGTGLSIRDLWATEFETAIGQEEAASGVERSHWRASGRKTKTNPKGEDYRWWKYEGLQMLNRWHMWRLAHPDWVPLLVSAPKAFLTTGLIPAIELDVSVELGGITVKAYMDRAFYDETNERVVIVDIKSGAWPPKDFGQQLGLYATGLGIQHGVDAFEAAYWMARAGDFAGDGKPLDVSRFNADYWTQVFTQFKAAKDSGIYLPRPDMFCGSCGVRDYCLTFGGSSAGLADSLAPVR